MYQHRVRVGRREDHRGADCFYVCHGSLHEGLAALFWWQLAGRNESVDIASLVDEIDHTLGGGEGLYPDCFRDMDFITAIFKDFSQVA